jgi:CRISPR-associated helicase Cas3
MVMSREERPPVEEEDERLRIASLNAWHPQVVVCTIDTVLALVRNNRRGLYASPAILSGGFVFDEIHAYDDEMFAAMVAFIRALSGAPFLLMSASLPTLHKSYLEQHLGDLGTVTPPGELEVIPRYRFQRAISTGAALQLATVKVRAGGRVLWVCNVVARAQAIHEQARASGLAAINYHSRFKYQDRVDRHRQVVDGFASSTGGGLLAVTTQVAEMSLDLDADLLISELAPVPALIQRLGRLNRRVSERDPGTAAAGMVYCPRPVRTLRASRPRPSQSLAGRPDRLESPAVAKGSQRSVLESARSGTVETRPANRMARFGLVRVSRDGARARLQRRCGSARRHRSLPRQRQGAHQTILADTVQCAAYGALAKIPQHAGGACRCHPVRPT